MYSINIIYLNISISIIILYVVVIIIVILYYIVIYTCINQCWCDANKLLLLSIIYGLLMLLSIV